MTSIFSVVASILFTTAAQQLPDDREPLRPVTVQDVPFQQTTPAFGRGRGGLGAGSPQWLDGDHWLENRDGRLLKIEARTGHSQPFLDSTLLERALLRLPALKPEAARAIAHRPVFDMDPTKRGFVFEYDQELYFATFDGSTAVRLTNSPGREQWPRFSPDGKLVAFVRDFELFVVDVGSQNERRLSAGGTNELRHGHASWVYFEEIFNRHWPAFWWSPDSKQLAFLEFDDSAVPLHTVLNDVSSPTAREVEETRYPRAGEPNPKVRLGIVAATGGAVQWADLSAYSPESSLISEVGWWPDGRSAYCYVQNRTQTWLDLVTVTPAAGAVQAAAQPRAPVRRLFRDATAGWIESPGPIHPYKDNSFLWLSERDGWKHIYQYDRHGKLKARITSGPWEVGWLEHVDFQDGWIYFSGTRDNPMAMNLYRTKPGGPIERLTQAAGNHAVAMSPDGKLSLASWSDTQTPNKCGLYAADGRLVRMTDTTPSDAAKRYRLGPRQRLQIPARDGFLLEAELILPSDLDQHKKYPVWFTTYGGPHAPCIADAWSGGRLWDHALAHEGFVVFRVDPRSASGKGAVSAWKNYKHLGVQELEDIKDAIAWLKQKPYVDGSRIGMTGASYGGFMTSYALTHCDLFAAGIAGALVTDWRDYDSIYTERYMGLPQDNREGYDASSVVAAARNLHGKLLILHGAMDDNVSLRHTMRLVEALQAANKEFELMIYPRARHRMSGPHYVRVQIDFMRRALGSPTPEKEKTGTK
jgi:dipeptidyl-peptidase 4